MVWAIALLLTVAGCDCSDSTPPRSLTIVEPACGGTVGLADDVDADAEGIQIRVTVEGRGLDGEEVSLFPQADPEPGDAPLATSTIGDDGTAVFTVTLAGGEYALEAQARDGAVQSPSCALTVEDSCASISFVTPAPPPAGENLTLGPAADEDGTECGETFETTVVVSATVEDGQPARIIVNGTVRGTVEVDAMVARFSGVALDARGDDPNVIEVEVERPDGVTCRETFPSNVYVDCDGVSCTLTLPEADPDHPGFLSQSHDTSDAEGFQTDFQADTDAEAVGQPAELVIDGDVDAAREATVTMEGSGGSALFANVALSEGTHQVFARCFDDVGNVTRSGVAEWTVDITPCAATIDSVAEGHDPITDLDDLDDTTDGIQVGMTGTVSGDACETVRVGPCSSLSAADASSGSFDETITLGSSATQDVCVEVEDEAGNVATVTETVNVRTDAPQVGIVSPADGTEYNADGTGGRTADLNTGTTACDAAFVVNCTDVGVPVEILRDGTSTVLGSADCEATSGLPSPYVGQATFTSVALPSSDSGSTISIVARQTVSGLVGLSSPISVQPDCNPPTLLHLVPACGAVLRPSTDDQDTSTSEFDYAVTVTNPNTPKPPVTLTIRNSGGSVVYTETSSMPASGSTTQFPDATWGSGGELEVEICATDGAGNTTCETCTVTVADLPVVTITEPTNGSVVTASDDCDGGTTAMDLRVRATTDAAAGSSAEVTIGGGTPIATTVMSGSGDNFVEVCTPVSDGRDVVIEVSVTDATRGTASAMVTIDIDTQAPATAIDDLVATISDRRGGEVTFEWTAVEDAGGFLLDAYEMRCAASEITDEAGWAAADAVPVTVAPGSATTIQSEMIGGFRVGTTVYCTLRGRDVAGDLTPLASPASVEVTVPFMTQDVTETGTTALGSAVTAVGDVNDDGVDDVLIGAPDSATAYLYFGSGSGLAAAPNVEIAAASGTRFGAQVAALGDMNGDGRADFAVSAPTSNGFAGAVYVFWGRADTDPWPAAIDLTLAPTCGADLCLQGAAGSPPTLLGVSVGAGDVNGDGLFDLIVGALRSNTAGRVFVILGSDAFPAGDNYTIPAAMPSLEPAGFVIDAPTGVMFMGRAVDSAGDFTGDGRHDLLIGAEGSSSSSIQGAFITVPGRAYPAAADGLSLIPAADVTIVDRGADGRFGRVVRSVGDLDGDGRVDVAVYEGYNASGTVYVYRGGVSGYSAASRVTYSNGLSGAASDDFGSSIGQAYMPWLGLIGDLDGDLRGDLLAGSVERGTGIGTADLFYGENPLSAKTRIEADAVLDPTSTETSGARMVGYIGDVNQDGFPDLAVGEPGYGSGAGRITIYY